MFLVVLEVHDIGRAEHGGRSLSRPADHLSRRPGADHRLIIMARPVAQLLLETVVVDDLEAGLADGGDEVGLPAPAEHHLDAVPRHFLPEVEGLDDAVHVQLEVEEQDPHPTVS